MSKQEDPHDWTGYIVVIPDQHNLVITGQWKKDRPDMWWWKCNCCKESSGVLSIIQLNKLHAKGMITEPDGEKLPGEYSGHPKEGYSMEDYYSIYGDYD